MLKKIFITGATGFVGSHIVSSLIKNNLEISILKRSTSDTWRISNNLDKVQYYDSDKIDMEEIFVKNDFDAVIHVATNYGKKETDSITDIFTTNVTLPIQLAELSDKYGVKTFWNTDSYWNTDGELNESINLYTYTKKITKDVLAEGYFTNLQIFNMKLFHVFGDKDSNHKFINYVAECFKKNETLDMTTGEQKLDFIHVEEVANIFLYLIMNHHKFTKPFEEFDLGSGEAVSLKNFVEILKKSLKSSSKIRYGYVPYRKNEIMYACANVDKLKNINYKFQFKGLEDSISHFIKSIK